MQIAQTLAGYSLSDADNLRKAMGKKKKEEMDKERDRFQKGAVGQGIKADLATRIFEQMEKFAAYGFNKSHSAAYALISFQTRVPQGALPDGVHGGALSLEMGDTDSTYKNIAECRAHGIAILPPDINESGEKFTVIEQGIRFGLGAVKGVGSKAIEIIQRARDEGGPYKDLADFCNRVRGQQINRRTLESLIKCGAFDSLHASRATMLSGGRARRHLLPRPRHAVVRDRGRVRRADHALQARGRGAAAAALERAGVDRQAAPRGREGNRRLLHHRSPAR